MVDLQQLLNSTSARERLRAIPGVERVGLGLKEKGGAPVLEYAFRVYVRSKKPLSALLPEEVIPFEIDGVKTDVVVLQDAQPLCGPALLPGEKITREIANYPEAGGTLGCVVRKGPNTYILTNQHVIVPRNVTPTSDDVYQPDKSECAEIRCNSPVAKVVGEVSPWAFKGVTSLGGRTYTLDCALIQINSGISFANTIDDAPMQAQIRDVATEASVPLPPDGNIIPPGTIGPASPITLHKHGAKTDKTTGLVVEFCHEEKVNGSAVIYWELVILPTLGENYSETYTIKSDEKLTLDDIVDRYKGHPVTATRVVPGNPTDRRIHFEGKVFALKGDSGSVCVDDAKRASGLLYAVQGTELSVEEKKGSWFVPAGRGVACHIRPVFESLGLDPATAILVGTNQASSLIRHKPGDALSVSAIADSSLAEGINTFGDAIQATEEGRRLFDIFATHHHEVLKLVNHRRRVTVAWHRVKGPGFVVAFLNSVRTDTPAIPPKVAGHSLSQLLEKMMLVLELEGSHSLRQAIHDEQEFLREVALRCECGDQPFANRGSNIRELQPQA